MRCLYLQPSQSLSNVCIRHARVCVHVLWWCMVDMCSWCFCTLIKKKHNHINPICSVPIYFFPPRFAPEDVHHLVKRMHLSEKIDGTEMSPQNHPRMERLEREKQTELGDTSDTCRHCPAWPACNRQGERPGLQTKTQERQKGRCPDSSVSVYHFIVVTQEFHSVEIYFYSKNLGNRDINRISENR